MVVLLDEAVPLGLVLAPALLGALLLPVARDGLAIARHAALDEEVAPELADVARLAVEEDVRRAGREVEGRDGRAEVLDPDGPAIPSSPCTTKSIVSSCASGSKRRTV